MRKTLILSPKEIRPPVESPQSKGAQAHPVPMAPLPTYAGIPLLLLTEAGRNPRGSQGKVPHWDQAGIKIKHLVQHERTKESKGKIQKSETRRMLQREQQTKL